MKLAIVLLASCAGLGKRVDDGRAEDARAPVSRLVNWARAKSLWIFPFGECAFTAERTASIAAQVIWSGGVPGV